MWPVGSQFPFDWLLVIHTLVIRFDSTYNGLHQLRSKLVQFKLSVMSELSFSLVFLIFHPFRNRYLKTIKYFMLNYAKQGLAVVRKLFELGTKFLAEKINRSDA